MSDSVITVRNADGEPDTQAQIIIQNKIDYTPKVSVIIPVYNTEEYLRECMDSVINQTLKEIEIICVDDGSTDGSLEILKEYAAKDRRITVITQENQGVGKVRNRGIRDAAGEFIAFMDSDDYYLDDKILEDLYTTAKKTGLLICGGSLSEDHNNGKWIRKEFSGIYKTKYTFTEEKYIAYKDYQFDYGFYRFIYQREFCVKNNIYFPPYIRFQDPPFFVKAMIIAGGFYALPRVTYCYRYGHQNLKWDEKRICAILNGFIDNLTMSADAKLDELHRLTVYRMLGEYKDKIVIGLEINSEAVMTLLLTAEQKIAKEYVKDTDYESGIAALLYEWNTKTKHRRPPKVSVIMPCYNVAPYLRKALDSVINQTLKDIEIICVNDGSTDNTLDIIKEYAARDKRIVVIDGPNGGYGKAMNKGLDVAAGEYIGIVETDDYIELDMYEELYKKARETNVDFVKGDIWFWWSEKNERKYSNIITDKNLYNKVLHDLSDMGLIVGAIANYAGIYKARFIRDYNIRYNETPGASFQDQGFYYQVTFNAKSALFIDKPVYHYRQDNVNSSINTPGKVICIFEEYKFVFDKLNELPQKVRFLPLVYTKMINSYLWNLSKSEESIYPAVKSKVAFEFQKAINNGLSKKIVGENIWNKVVPFLSNTVVPIILSSDDNYAPYMYVTMYSALENAMPDTFYDFYLLVPSAFSKRNTDLIMELKEKYNCDIHFIDMKNAFADLTMHIPHVTSPTYYRLLAGDLLPKEYDKCIYLDVDVCVCRDLVSLYNIDIGSNYIAGVVAAAYYLNQESHCKRLGLPSMEQYVNAGVLLMNLKQIRQDGMTARFVELSKNDYSSQDQDVINVACYGRILTLPVKYNVMTKYKALFDAGHEQRAALEEIYGAEHIGEGVRSPVIVHYADKIKPWNDVSMKMMGYWWKYAQCLENNEMTSNNKAPASSPLLYKDIGLGCNTWCAPQTVSGNAYTYDLSDNIYTSYVSWDPIKEGSCDVEIVRLSAVEKRSGRVVEFPVDRIISSGKITGSKVEFRNQKCWIGCAVEGAYESLTVEASVSRV